MNDVIKKRVLVVDDSISMRVLLRDILESEGFEVIEAGNGNEGLRLFQNDPTSLIITDIVMPEMEGLQFIRELRGQYKEVKIIAVSGGGYMAPEDYLKLAKRFGAMQTFIKPFDKREILKAVHDLLKA